MMFRSGLMCVGLGLSGSVHTIKDPSKDKPFELEMSWLSEETNWQHEIVPRAEV
jgi:hypothetical protein